MIKIMILDVKKIDIVCLEFKHVCLDFKGIYHYEIMTLKITLKIHSNAEKPIGTKGMSNAENFSVWFKTFQCDFSVLEQQRKIFQWDNPGLSLWFPL